LKNTPILPPFFQFSFIFFVVFLVCYYDEMEGSSKKPLNPNRHKKLLYGCDMEECHNLFDGNKCETYWPDIFEKISKVDHEKERENFIPVFKYDFYPTFYSDLPPAMAYKYCAKLNWNSPESEYTIELYMPKDITCGYELIWIPKKGNANTKICIVRSIQMSQMIRNIMMEIVTLSTSYYNYNNISSQNSNIREVWMYKCTNNSDASMEFVLFMNTTAVSRLIKNGQSVPAQDIVLPYIYGIYAKTLEERILEPQKRPNLDLDYAMRKGWDPSPDEKIVDHVWKLKNSLETELFEYQKNVINWMIYIETDICNRKLNFPFLIDLQVLADHISEDQISETEIHYDAKGLHASPTTCHLFASPKEEFTSVKGGIVADEMGLGKSFEMLSLIAISKMNDLENEKEEKAIGRDSTARIEAPYISNATLIICPGHLCNQWKGEYLKNFKKNMGLDIVVLTTSGQLAMEISNDLKKIYIHEDGLSCEQSETDHFDDHRNERKKKKQKMNLGNKDVHPLARTFKDVDIPSIER